MSSYQPITTERKERIDSFLKRIGSYAFSNNMSKNELENMIYANLSALDIPNFSNKEHPELFNEWVTKYQGNPKMEVFVQDDFQHFCQFLSYERLGRGTKETDYIKMYIPLDKEHLDIGVKKIFDFCCQNDIKHVSKVSKTVRNDDVVVRTLTIEDTNKVINFVENDPYIQESKIKPNPFCIQTSNIGFAVDRTLSYNKDVTELITSYLTQKIDHGIFNASYEDFCNYSSQIEYEQTKKNEVLKLINLALKTNDLIVILDQFKNVSMNRTLQMSDEQCFTTLNECLNATKEKYGERQTYNALLYYLRDDNPSCFTRYSNNDTEKKTSYRNKMIKIDNRRIEKLLRKSLQMNENSFDYATLTNTYISHLYGTDMHYNEETDLSFTR